QPPAIRVQAAGPIDVLGLPDPQVVLPAQEHRARELALVDDLLTIKDLVLERLVDRHRGRAPGPGPLNPSDSPASSRRAPRDGRVIAPRRSAIAPDSPRSAPSPPNSDADRRRL